MMGFCHFQYWRSKIVCQLVVTVFNYESAQPFSQCVLAAIALLDKYYTFPQNNNKKRKHTYDFVSTTRLKMHHKKSYSPREMNLIKRAEYKKKSNLSWKKFLRWVSFTRMASLQGEKMSTFFLAIGAVFFLFVPNVESPTQNPQKKFSEFSM